MRVTVDGPEPGPVDRGRTRQASSRRTRCSPTRPTSRRMWTRAAWATRSPAGIEFIDEEQYSADLRRASARRSAGESRTTRTVTTRRRVYAPVRNGVYTRGETQTAGVYAVRHVSFAEQLAGDRRLPRRSASTRTSTACVARRRHRTQPAGGHAGPRTCSVDDTLFSYKVGVLFKPVRERQHLSVARHLAAAAGRRELHAARRRRNNSVNNPDLDPTEGENLELGTKWEFQRWRAAP